MKKFLLVILSFVSFTLFGIEIGNPCQSTLLNKSIGFKWLTPDYLLCDWIDFRVGYMGDYVYNFPTKIADKNYGENNRTSWTTNSLYLATNFFNRIDFISTYGVTKIELQKFVPSGTNIPGPGIPTTQDFISTSDFSYSTGIHATLFRFCGFCLGGGGDFFYTRPQIDYANYFFGYPIAYANSNDHLKLTMWQLFGGLSYSFSIAPSISIIPFGAIKWNWLQLKGSNAAIRSFDPGLYDYTGVVNNYQAARDFGYALGITLAGCERFSGSLEGRFGNELAFSFDLQARF